MKKVTSLLLALLLALSLALPGLADAPAALTATAEAEQIQKYGNVVLSLSCDAVKDAGYQYGDVVTVSFLDQSMDIPFCNNYSDVDSGSPALFARDGDPYALLAINMGDFATTYGIATKTTNEDKSFFWTYQEGVTGPVSFTISLCEAGGYYDEFVMHQLKYTNVREDYPELTDAEFANFRAVSTGGMGAGVLYRTASPVNPENNRNSYADAALAEAGVTVVMNLADDQESLTSYEGFADSYYATTNYIVLNMGVDFTAEDFQTKLAEGLRHFAENPGVYAVHCTEGKDRAGFVVAVLECLMGASYDEVLADYMLTYYNYYGVTAEDPRYETIANSNIVKSLQRAFDVQELQSADLAAEAEEYLLAIGLSEAELAALKANLNPAPVAEVPAQVVLSPQNLKVDGRRRRVEMYNIDGYNYFKLRDLAVLLNDTPAQFSVDWDAETNTVLVVSGEAYSPVGGELVQGEDRSATAVRSPQTICIDGAERSDLPVYNLGGNNFFRLRSLGEALNFQVDFDAENNTVVILSGTDRQPVG